MFRLSVYIRKEPVRFDSFRFRILLKNMVSVQFSLTIVLSDSMRFGLHFLNASWFGPVRFGSAPRSVPAGSETKRFGSVRFGRFGSVSYSFLMYFRWGFIIISPTIISEKPWFSQQSLNVTPLATYSSNKSRFFFWNYSWRNCSRLPVCEYCDSPTRCFSAESICLLRRAVCARSARARVPPESYNVFDCEATANIRHFIYVCMCMYVCMYVCMYIYIYIYIYTYTYVSCYDVLYYIVLHTYSIV